MTIIRGSICVAFALSASLAVTSSALADGRDWNDGPVINVAAIRTVDGHFDDYMHWLATTWKKQEETAKAAGLITKYRVLVVESHSPTDPDIYLVTEFKNWAVLDSLGANHHSEWEPSAWDRIMRPHFSRTIVELAGLMTLGARSAAGLP